MGAGSGVFLSGTGAGVSLVAGMRDVSLGSIAFRCGVSQATQ